ncbi:MAG: GntR family transcriptional regulator [Acholeplasmatales bacterium]|jgi:GntR family transcriptional regulator|nr:GntR family transcriptional regulator [Acholeplasmataceae bacterium]MCK9289840.1 GntR family transcriptional regulator [Acholeplasmataceae bacterium]MCK9428292.1 GntR family transcriptional regulator [Acholeplasmataceae bacterium]MDY0115911.1 GntR family transcriptional regulator [Acholeplasmatales bacterium]
MNKPLFEQIYETYKKYILLGIYKPGDKLPSVREVGEKMGVNPHTVNRGFLMLEEEGLVETIFKKGSFVRATNNKKSIITELVKDLNNYKLKGISKDEILKVLKKVYGDNND